MSTAVTSTTNCREGNDAIGVDLSLHLKKGKAIHELFDELKKALAAHNNQTKSQGKHKSGSGVPVSCAKDEKATSEVAITQDCELSDDESTPKPSSEDRIEESSRGFFPSSSIVSEDTSSDVTTANSFNPRGPSLFQSSSNGCSHLWSYPVPSSHSMRFHSNSFGMRGSMSSYPDETKRPKLVFDPPRFSLGSSTKDTAARADAGKKGEKSPHAQKTKTPLESLFAKEIAKGNEDSTKYDFAASVAGNPSLDHSTFQHENGENFPRTFCGKRRMCPHSFGSLGSAWNRPFNCVYSRRWTDEDVNLFLTYVDKWIPTDGKRQKTKNDNAGGNSE